MSTINVRSNLTGRVYPILIAGDTPTDSEDKYIQNYVNSQDGVLIGVPPEDKEEETLIGNPLDFVQSGIGSFIKGYTDIPGGIASIGEGVGEKLGADVAPGESGIGQSAQDFSKGAAKTLSETFDFNESVMSKAGQAFGSIGSFLAGGFAVKSGLLAAKVAPKIAQYAGFGTVAGQGAAIQSQDQMNRIANFLEKGGVIDGSQKADAVLLSALLGTSEAIPFVALSKSLGASLRILKKVDKKNIDKAVKTIGGRIKRSLITGGVEGGQEAIAGYTQDLIEQNIYNPNVIPGQSAYDDAVYGGGAAGALNLILDSIRGRKINNYERKQTQLDEDALEEGREGAEKLKNAEEYLKTQQAKQVSLLEGPGLGLPAPDTDIIAPTGNEAVDVVNQSVADAQTNQKIKDTEETLQAARETRTPFKPVKIEDLPQDEAFKIRKQRIELGKSIPVDDPATLEEIQEVVGEEAATREAINQKPSLYKPEPMEDPEANKLYEQFAENLLKQKVINRASAKKVWNNLFKEKLPDLGADGSLLTLLSAGRLKYLGKGKYAPKDQTDINLDLVKQASALSEQARRIRTAENQLRKEQEKFTDDPVNFETYNQQLELLQKQYSDLQLESFALENKANKLVDGQETIQARRIAPSLAPKKVFDEAPKAKETPEYKLKQKRVIDALRSELNRIGLSDVRLEGVPLLDQAQLTKELQQGNIEGITEGVMDVDSSGKRVIALAMELYDPNMTDAELELKLGSVMNHEIIHALRSLNVFTDAEYQSLAKAVKTRKYVKRSRGKNTTRDYTYYERASHARREDMSEDEVVEEAIAEMYRDYTDGKLKLAGKPKSLFDRIIKFIKSIFSSHSQEGFTEVDQIFENIGTTETENQISRRDRKPEDVSDQAKPKRSRIIIDRLPSLHKGSIGPLPIAHFVKAKYLASKGIPNLRPDRYVEVNVDLAKKIARDFDQAINEPDNPTVIESYKAMADETFDQWQFIKDTGITIEFIKPDQANPYPKGSKDLLIDINKNHMWVFATDDGFGSDAITDQDIKENPLLQKTGEIIDGRDVRYNDLFRIVHDYFGHALEGATFSPRGEENAWQAHVRMYSPLAAKAMTTETRGQNSWLNYSDAVGDFNRNSTNKAEETIYADQKITLLSDFVMNEGLANNIEGAIDERTLRANEQLGKTGDVGNDRGGDEGGGRRRTDVPSAIEQAETGRKPKLSPQKTVKLTHFSPIEGLQSIDPDKQRSNLFMRGEERRRTFEGYPARSYYAINIEDPNGYNPEQNVGDNVYELDAPYEGMYDWEADPEKFNDAANIELNKERPDIQDTVGRVNYITTAKERMIKEFGATGYWINSPSRGPMAAMFYELTVPETYQAKKYNQAYKDSVNQKRGVDAKRTMRSVTRVVGQEHTVSTRFPTAGSREADPSTNLMFINGETIKNDKKLAGQAANIIKKYNLSENSKDYVNFSDQEIIEDHIEAMTDNILFVHDTYQPEYRERSSKWYDGARAIVDRFAKEYNYPPEVVAAVIAIQSPQKDWFMNVSLGERVLDISRNHGNKEFTPAMVKTAKRIYGDNKAAQAALKFIMSPMRNSSSLDSLEFSMHRGMWIRIFDETYNDRGHRIVTPEGEFLDYARKKDGNPKGTGWGSNRILANSAQALDLTPNTSLQEISILLGDRHKVRSFFNNMITPMSPDGHSTIDTHAVAVAFFKPLSGKAIEVEQNFGIYTGRGKSEKYGVIPNSSVTGARGMYGLIADAYARAAERRGVLPRQMQSITWEPIRGLFPDTFKNKRENIENINRIWQSYTDGGLTLDETREEIINATPAGFTEPSWARPIDTIPEFSGNSSYERELSRPYVPGRNTRDDSGVGGTVAGEPSTRKSRIRATPFSDRQQQQVINDRDIAAAQQNIRYDNLSGLIAKALKIAPKFLLRGNTRAQAAQKIVQKYQDSFQPVGSMMDELRQKGYTIADAMDPYLRELNSSGIIGSNIIDQETTIVKPMLEDIEKLDFTEDQINELERLSTSASLDIQDGGFVKKAIEVAPDQRIAVIDAYLYAMHAKERNLEIQAKHKRGLGSGMSEAESNAILDWVDGLSDADKNIIRSVDAYVKRIIESTNNIRFESGLITQEEYDGRTRFQHYVPLRGDLDADQEFKDDAKNSKRRTVNYFGALGKEDKAARGRGPKYAENLLASAISQNVRAIDRSERNKAGQDLLRLLRGQEEQEDGSLATNDALAADLQQNFAEITDVQDVNDPYQLVVKENGEQVYVNFYRESLARAFKSHYEPKQHIPIIRALAKLNRFLSNISTTYNPAFVIPNFAKDLETALVNIQQHDAEGVTKEILRDVGSAINGIRKVLRTTDDTSFWSEEYKKFVKAGGKNATNQMGTVEDQMNNMNDLLTKISKTTSLGLNRKNFFYKGGQSLLKFLDDYNTMIENGVRVATFTNLKKRGFTDARAAEAARNVTVNFAKGGEDKVFMNSLYLFYNASLQGSMAIFNAAYKSSKVRKLLGGLIIYGILQDQLMAFFRDPEDEDEQNPYDKLQDYQLEHNLVFGNFGLSDEKFTTIPLAYGLNMPFNLGRALSRYTRGEYTFGQMSDSIFGTTMETLSPFGAIENWESYLVPTAGKPLAEMALNKNYRNDPIYKETPMYASRSGADAYTHWGTTGPVSKFIAQSINDITLGDEVESGLIDVSPDTLEYFYEYVIGGAGAFIGRSANLVAEVIPAIATGDFSEINAYKIPFVRKVITQPSERVDTSNYLEKRKELFTIFARIDLARRRGEPQNIRNLMSRYDDEIKVYGRFKALDNARNRLLRQIRELERNLRIPDDVRKRLIKLRTERIQEIMKKGILLMRSVGIRKTA